MPSSSSSPAPKVSILMLTYDRSQRLGEAIASAREQTFTDWELILVQDGDHPETTQRAIEWAGRELRVRYFHRGTLGAIAEASNFGLEQARGEYVAILDDDDRWNDREKLAAQVDFLDRNPEYVACAGGYTVTDQDGNLVGLYLKPEQDQAIRSRALIANPVANSTAIFRRLAGGSPIRYDASIRQFADWDFWLTMGGVGKIYNFPRSLAEYTLWSSGSSFKNQRGNARAAVRIVCKHRRHYRGFPVALGMALLYYAYAHLPLTVRRFSYAGLSSLKKALTGARPKPSSAA